MGRIYQREKIWYLDITVDGKRLRRKVGTSKKIAELALKDAEVKVARKEFGFLKKEIPISLLIAQFMAYNQTNHRPATVKRYKAVLSHFQEYLNARQLDSVDSSKVTVDHIEGFKAFRRTVTILPNGQKLTPEKKTSRTVRTGAKSKTVNFELDCLKTMFNLGIRLGYLTKNPVGSVRPLKSDVKKPPRMLSVEETERLLSSADGELKPILVTLLQSGLRKGELEHLQWRDVDFKRRRIIVQAKGDWSPKTTGREIPMSHALGEVLLNHRKHSAKTEPSDYVFEILDGTHSHNWIRTQLIKLARASGVPNLTTVHALRHTFASHLVMQGVDLPTVSKLLGHTDIQTTMIYAHLAGDHLASAVEKLPFRQ